MDSQKDEYIKEKLQKDVLISKKADSIFNDFLKGDYKNMEENNHDKTIDFTKAKNKSKNKNTKVKGILATVATFFIIIGSVNVYASTNGYGNIFFLIKYLVTGENSSVVTGKENILTDQDITISYEEIRILPKVSIQIKKMQIKDGKAYLYIVENSTETSDDIVPLTYKVYDQNDKELGEKESSNNTTEQIVIMDNYQESDKILNLKIYKTNSDLITTLKIDLDSKTIEVEGEEEALQKISEIELKDFLGKVTLIYDIAGNMRSNIELLGGAMMILSDREVSVFYENPSNFAEIEKDEVDKTLLAIANVKIPEKTSTYKTITHNNVSYYEFLQDFNEDHTSTCLNISDISYCAGEYTVTYTFANAAEIDSNNYTIYENVINISLNDDFHYSKFRIDSVIESKIISEAEDNGIGTFEEVIDLTENTISNNVVSTNNTISTNTINQTNTLTNTTNQVINITSSNTATQDTSKVDNYASTMSWTSYWAPGIKFSYPTIFNLKEIGGSNRGSMGGECTTEISGIATGKDPDTNEIINSNLLIKIYEPFFAEDDSSYMLDDQGYFIGFTNSQGYKWAEKAIITDGDENYSETYYHSEELDSGEYVIYRIDFITDNSYNYKVTNIINWFLGTTKTTSY